MPRPAEPGRALLLDAGRRLLRDAAGTALPDVSVNDVVAAAGRSKGAFYQHYPDRTSYLAALHDHFHDELEARVLSAIGTQEPGALRLQRGARAFLDGCLEPGTTKTLLLQARHDPQLQDLAASRDQAFAALAEADFAALGARDPASTAVLFVAMVAAIAHAEATRGKQPRLRRALDALLAAP